MASTVCSCSVYVSITCVILLSLLAQSHGHYSRPAILDSREVIVETGDNYTALCEGDSPLNWTWSDMNEFPGSEKFKVEIIDVLPKSKSHASRIFLQNVNFLHTGYLTCFYKNVPRSNDNQMDQIYMYVRDPNHLAVTVQEVETILVTQYSDAVIPCKPTSPDVKVELTLITGEQTPKLYVGTINEDGTMYTFHPHYGFKTNSTQVPQQELYTCTFTRDNESATMTIILEVESATVLPLLEEKSGGHTLIGEKLILECKIRSPTYITFTWTTPTGPYNRDRMELSTQKKDPGYNEVVQILTIKNATKYDKGVYYCNVTDNQNHTSGASIRVNVYDKN